MNYYNKVDMMKGLILSGGYGTRLRPLTYSQQKQLIPIANKPILFYTIEELIKAKIKNIGIIVGPNKEQIIEAVNNAKFDAKITFIEQDSPKGLAHAVLISEKFLGDDPFVMYLGDNLLKNGIKSHVDVFLNSDVDASILLTEHKNPSLFGCVKFKKNGSIEKLIEKPKNPPSNFILIGVYFFKKSIFEAAKKIKPSWRNELEITDAIQYLIDNGFKVHSQIVEGWWKDTGKTEDILDANRLMLDEINFNTDRKKTNRRGEKFSVSEGTKIDKKSVIKDPSIIGKNCLIKNSYIGPYTSIGNECTIINSELENSIVMDGTKIINAKKIIESLIGRDVNIEKSKISSKGIKFVIGDHSEVKI